MWPAAVKIFCPLMPPFCQTVEFLVTNADSLHNYSFLTIDALFWKSLLLINSLIDQEKLLKENTSIKGISEQSIFIKYIQKQFKFNTI